MFGFPLFSSLLILKLCSWSSVVALEDLTTFAKPAIEPTLLAPPGNCLIGIAALRLLEMNLRPTLHSPFFSRCQNLTSFLNLFSASFPRTPGKGKRVCYYHTSLLDFTIIRYLYQNCDQISQVLLIPSLISMYRDQVLWKIENDPAAATSVIIIVDRELSNPVVQNSSITVCFLDFIIIGHSNLLITIHNTRIQPTLFFQLYILYRVVYCFVLFIFLCTVVGNQRNATLS